MCAAALGRPPVLLDIVEEHFDELDFLWAQRESVVFAPDWNLEELAELEERAEAHLDALRLAEGHAVDLATRALADGDATAVAAAAFVIAESGHAPAVDALFEAVAEAAPETVEGVRSALRHVESDALAARLVALVENGAPSVRAAAFDVLAFQRRELPAGLGDLLGAEEAEVRRLAWGAAGRAVGVADGAHLEVALADEDASVRRAALQACARLGTAGLRDRCLALATDPEALTFLGVLGHPGDLPTLIDAIAVPDLSEAALSGLGALGLPGAVPPIIAAMGDDATARAAGAAFVRITGFEDIERSVDVEGAASREEAPEDVVDDEDLPPDPDRARTFWDAAADRFHPQQSWQRGIPAADGLAAMDHPDTTLESRRDLWLRECANRGPAVGDRELEARARHQAAGSS